MIPSNLMTIVKLLIATLSSALFLCSCGEKEIPRDVNYYLENLDEAKAKMDICNNDARNQDNPNCLNAEDAVFRAAQNPNKYKKHKAE